jgi:hypothetical protein
MLYRVEFLSALVTSTQPVFIQSRFFSFFLSLFPFLSLYFSFFFFSFFYLITLYFVFGQNELVIWIACEILLFKNCAQDCLKKKKKREIHVEKLHMKRNAKRTNSGVIRYEGNTTLILIMLYEFISGRPG